MHSLQFEFLGIEENVTKDKKKYFNIHLLNGFDSIKFYLTDENKELLDKIKPSRLQLLECEFDVVPVTYQQGGFNQTVFALKLKSIIHTDNEKKGEK